MAEKEKQKKKDEWADRLHEVYEDWGSYMSYKKAKLEEQYKEEVGTDFANASSLFKGISIFVNGYTDPPSDELRRLMMAHGGVFHHYLRTGKTTHIIATNLPYSKIVAYKKAQNPLPLCKPEWLTDSIKAGRVLDYRKYLLYSQHTKTQPKLAHVFVRNHEPQTKISQKENSPTDKTIETRSLGMSATSELEKSVVEGENKGQGQPEPTFQAKPVSKSNGEVTVFTSTQQKPKETEPESNQSSGQGQPKTFQSKPSPKSKKEDTVFTSTQQQSNKTESEPKQKSVLTSTERNCTKNEQFLQEFYNNSRLHHISTMGAMFKEYINEKREKHNGEFSGLTNLLSLRKMNQPGPSTRSDFDFDLDSEEVFESKSNRETVIMHIDMDCFFVSVGLRNNPHLRGLPVAVAHAKSNKTDEELGSMSELASCSYEARKAGVKNGMFLGQAIKLCPNLKTIRYDFEGYKEVSFCLYDTVASYTMQIEAVSCDEMYVDCTELLAKSKLSSMEFANILRREINEKTGCPVSTGFGSNKLQARLATKKAKPNGQFHLKQEEILEYIGSLAVKDLPGVGYSTASKLKQMNVQNCADLQKVSIGELQKEFGTKSGQLLYSMCRGIDNSKLNLEHVRKSVSAEVNYGIRFENEQDARNFLTKLSLEVSERLKKVNAGGRSVTLKLMVRAKEAPRETRKFMGHGVCDYFTKTKNLMTAVDDVSIITKEILSLWNQMQKEPEEIRGIGIQMSRLESKKTKSASSILLNFIEKGNKDKKQQQEQQSCSEEKVSESSPEMEFEEPNVVSNDKEDEENSINPACNSSANLPIRSQPKTQTKPEDFFKKTKPTVSRNAKVELPSLQEIDMAVLVELPENIRNEILNEYKTRNSSGNELRLENRAKSPPRDPNPVIVNKRLEQVRMEEDQNESEISFSQVDPDFLAALSEDMRNDVKMYCQMQKRKKEVINKKITLAQPTLSKPTILKPKRGRPRKIDRIANVVCERKVKKTVEIEKKDHEKKVENKIHCKKMMTERSEVQVFTEKKMVEKAKSPKDVIVFDNTRFGISDAKVQENEEILTRLVDCMLELPLMQAKGQVQAWIMNSESVDEIDLLSVVTYLGILPKKKRIDDLHTLLKTMHRCVTEVGNCVWHETYKKIVGHIQYNMQLEYNCDLMLSPVGCNNCMR